jgi:hypothetical protein
LHFKDHFVASSWTANKRKKKMKKGKQMGGKKKTIKKQKAR